MNVKTVPMSDLFDRCNDIYTTVLITAKRSRQIIDSRVLDFESLENVEDSSELEELENKNMKHKDDDKNDDENKGGCRRMEQDGNTTSR